MTPKPPVIVLDLFPEERRRLLSLLAELSPEQWQADTACPGWSVKDLAAHLLADDLGRLARGRDGYVTETFSTSPSWAELVAFVNRRNEEWVAALRRLSPRVLIDLLGWSGEQLLAHFRSLDLRATGGPVSWAGPEPAPQWLDTAREYTERWVHQQQIRDAVGVSGLRERRLFHPVLDTFAHALPHAYRDIAAPEGTHVRLIVTGDAGGVWSLVRRGHRWRLFVNVETPAVSAVTLDEDLAWRLFSKGVDANAAQRRTSIEGDHALGAVVLRARAIIA